MNLWISRDDYDVIHTNPCKMCLCVRECVYVCVLVLSSEANWTDQCWPILFPSLSFFVFVCFSRKNGKCIAQENNFEKPSHHFYSLEIELIRLWAIFNFKRAIVRVCGCVGVGFSEWGWCLTVYPCMSLSLCVYVCVCVCMCVYGLILYCKFYVQFRERTSPRPTKSDHLPSWKYRTRNRKKWKRKLNRGMKRSTYQPDTRNKNPVEAANRGAETTGHIHRSYFRFFVGERLLQVSLRNVNIRRWEKKHRSVAERRRRRRKSSGINK